MHVDALSAVLRALSFIALLQAAGVVFFLLLFGEQLSSSVQTIKRVGFRSALAGLVLVGAQYGLEAARMAGELSGALDFELQRLVLGTSMASAWMVRTVGLALMAAAMFRASRGALLIGTTGALLSLAAFLLVGHTASDPDRPWLALLLAIHLLVIAFWFGALLPLREVSQIESRTVAARVVESFSRIASWIVPAILVAGVLMTLLLVDRWSVFAESYGLILLGKVLAFLVLMVLAALNRWRYGPAIVATSTAVPAFRRVVLAEYVLILGVLAVTAVMTTLFSPEH